MTPMLMERIRGGANKDAVHVHNMLLIKKKTCDSKNKFSKKSWSHLLFKSGDQPTFFFGSLFLEFMEWLTTTGSQPLQSEDSTCSETLTRFKVKLIITCGFVQQKSNLDPPDDMLTSFGQFLGILPYQAWRIQAAHCLRKAGLTSNIRQFCLYNVI